MDITITQKLESTSWNSKSYGAIFVKNKEEIEIVNKLLIAQDDYFENHSNFVKVLPKNPTIQKLKNELEYTGRTDIYDTQQFLKDLKEQGVDVFIFCTSSQEWEP